MKDVAEWFVPMDFINLVSGKDDKAIIFIESIVYKDMNEAKVFSKEYIGLITDNPRGNSGNSLDKVASLMELVWQRVMTVIKLVINPRIIAGTSLPSGFLRSRNFPGTHPLTPAMKNDELHVRLFSCPSCANSNPRFAKQNPTLECLVRIPHTH